MTKHVNADSIIRGNFCDIVKFFRGRDIDDVDRLAQRALTIILRTDQLVQTGNEVDTDPFTANMFASAALESINRTLTTYPFVRESDQSPEADEEAVFESAKKLIETAERLSPDPTLLSLVHDAVDAYAKMFGPGAPFEGWFDIGGMEHAGAGHALHDDMSTLYNFSPAGRLLFLTDGFKNDEAGYERAMASAQWPALDLAAEESLAAEERRALAQSSSLVAIDEVLPLVFDDKKI